MTERVYAVRLNLTGGGQFVSGVAGSEGALNRLRASAASTAPQLDQVGISSKQMTAAMRGVPAQITDIVTSLQSGQAPLTVFLQQGGQLKDMFGGVAPAARALATTVASMVTPVTLAAAALATLTLGAYQGAKAQTALENGITLSGNAAGVTAGRVDALAASIASSSRLTIGSSREVALELVSSGKVGAGAIDTVSLASARFADLSGKTAAEAATHFEGMSTGVAAWAAENNRSWNFITADIYRNIKALEDRGEKEAAMVVAGQAFIAHVAEERRNLGYLQVSVEGVSKALSFLKDLLLNVGKGSTLTDQFTDQANRVRDAAIALGEAEKNGRLTGVIAERREYLKQQQEILAQVGARMQLEDVAARSRAAQAAAERKAIDDQIESDKKSEAAKRTAAAAAKAAALEQERNLKRQADAVAEAAGLTTDFAEKWQRLNDVFRDGNKVYADGETGYQKLAAAQAALLAQQPAMKRAAELEAASIKAAIAVAESRAAQRAAEQKAIDDFDAREDARRAAEIRTAEEALAAAEREYDAHGKTRSQIAEVTLQRLQDKQVAYQVGSANYEAVQREIDAQLKLIEVLRRGEVRTAAEQAAKESAAAWDSFAQDINRSLTDSLYRAFESGQGFGTAFFKSLVNTGKATIIKVGVQAVSSAATDALGLSNTIGAAGNVSSVLSSLSNLSTASTVASLAGTLGNFTAGLSAGFSQFTAGVNTFASLANASAVGGSSGLGIGIGAAGPYVAAALALYAIAQATKGETRGGGQYGYGSTGTGNYGLGNAAFIQGPSGGQIESSQVQSAINATIAGINATLRAVGSAATLTGFQAALETSGNGRGGVYAGGTLSTGATFGELGLGGGRSNYNGTLYEATSSNSPDAQAALANFSADLLQATIQALQAASDIPKSIADMLRGVDAESLSAEAAAALLASVNAMAAFEKAVSALPFASLRDLSYEAVQSLLAMTGGLEGLSSSLASYYQAYYTDTERQQQSIKSLQAVFAEIGLTMPSLTQSGEAARAQFRALVEAQDLNTEAGRTAYAALMGIAGAFAELAPIGANAGSAIDGVTGEVVALSQVMIDLRRDHLSLQDQYDRLTLSQADYRAKLVAGYTAEERAAAALNFALTDRIAAIQAEQALTQQLASLEIQLLQLEGNTAEIRRRELAALPASAQALQQLIYARTDEIAAAQRTAQAAQERAAAEKAIADKRATLENQLLQQLGDTAALRANELAALDPSNRAIQERIYALQDEAAATAAAQRAIEEAAQRAQAILNERTGLETQWLQLIGDTATLRQRELAALDPSNRALMELIYARQDQVAADEAAARAAQEAADAARQAAQAQLQAAQQAAQAAQAAADKVANEGLGLYKRLLQAQGDTATLRAMELAELDPANRALQQQIYALEDQRAAMTAAASAQERYTSAVAEAADFLAGVGSTIAAYFGRLRATPAGLGSPASQLAAARQQFQGQYALALGGNRDALSGITGYADQYLAASRATATSGLDVQRLIAQLETQLTALPASVRPEQLIVDAITTSTTTTTTNAGTLNSAAIAAAYAESQRGIAAAKAEADRLIAAAQAQAAAITANATAQAGTVSGAVNSSAGTVSGAVNASATATINALVANFDRLDTTADGLLSAAELSAALGPLATDSVLRAVFSTLDADGDGQISRLEAIRGNTNGLAAGIAGALSGAFDRLDTSVNGLLDQGELRAALGPLASDSVLRQIFATLDTDGDGQISRLEAIQGYTSATAYETRQTSLNALAINAATQQAAGNTLRTADNVRSLAFNTLIFDAAAPLRSVFDATKLAAEASASIWQRITNGQLGAYVTLAREQNADAAYAIGSNFMRAYAEWGGSGIKIESPHLGALNSNTAATVVNTANTVTQAQNTAVQALATAQRVDQVRERTNAAVDHLAVINTMTTLARNYLEGIFTGSPLRVYSFNRVVEPGFSVFATGGAFTNGIVRRPTAFAMGQMGEAGDEGILPLANVGGNLGVNAAGLGAGNRELVAEVRALRAELADLRREAQATAINTGKTARTVDRMERDGLTVRTEADEPLVTVAA